jgi:ABC-type phosphate/phosphonate transport system substrate-binding protein
VLDGRADAGAVGSPFWSNVQAGQIVPAGAVTAIWTSPPYSHCMFTARVDLEADLRHRFIDALLAMSIDNPAHRPILEAEGLKRWVAADLDGYGSLAEACREQGLFRRSPIEAVSG